MYNNGRDTPLDVFPLGSSAMSPFSRPITSPSLAVTSSVSLPNSVYSFTDFEPTSPKVLGYLSDPIHVERTLHPSDKKKKKSFFTDSMAKLADKIDISHW